MIFNNFWLKILSLALAVLTWAYIGEVILKEADGEGSPFHKIISPLKYVSQEFNIEPVFVGDPPSGYEFLREEATVVPSRFMLVGPGEEIKKIKTLKTQKISLSEHTKTITRDTGIMPISKNIDTSRISVKVTIPIRKTSP